MTIKEMNGDYVTIVNNIIQCFHQAQNECTNLIDKKLFIMYLSKIPANMHFQNFLIPPIYKNM